MPIYSTEPEESAPPVLTLVASNNDPQPQPPTWNVAEAPPRLQAAVEAVRGVVEASSFPASAVAFYCGDDMSADKVRAAALWMATLADALAAQEEQKQNTN